MPVVLAGHSLKQLCFFSLPSFRMIIIVRVQVLNIIYILMLTANSGSWTESTYNANESDFHRLHLRQRVLRDVSDLSLGHKLLGKPVDMPLALAPVGMCGMQHANGEIHAARAAEKFGVPFILSTMSICSIEDVAAAVEKPFWFQVCRCIRFIPVLLLFP